MREAAAIGVGAHPSPTPLCPAGHLPLKGGDRLAASAFANLQRNGELGRLRVWRSVPLLISPLEGEMSGRTEGGRWQMTRHPVPLANRRNARKMRKALTDAELKLWNELRAHRLMGLAFRRQMPIAGYIVDFACPQYKLIVELDGSQHAEAAAAEADIARTARLEALGWTVLRFWNDDILHDIDNVCQHVVIAAGLWPKTPAGRPMPLRSRRHSHDRPHRHFCLRLRQGQKPSTTPSSQHLAAAW